MKKIIRMLSLAGIAALLAGSMAPVWAAPTVNQADATKLLSYVKSNGLACMGCHAIDHKVVGPAWKDVALRYQGKPHAHADVAKAIANGNMGLWSGYPPMPPGLANAEQANHLAQLILNLVK